MMKNNLLILTLMLLSACSTHQPQTQHNIEGYLPLAYLTTDTQLAKSYDGKKVKIWGYPNYDTISTCGMATWHFAIQTDTYDGDTVHINTPASYDFAELYNDLRDKEYREKQKKVFVTGTLHIFPNASNFSTLADFEIDVHDANDIKLK